MVTVKTEEPLTAAELGKLWMTYMGNTMSSCVLKHFLAHVEDAEIKQVVEHGLQVCGTFVQKIKEIFTRDRVPIPVGFTDEDVNPEAPRMFADEFYLHYLQYAGKAGLSLYSIALPIMARSDVRDFFTQCMNETINLMNHVYEVFTSKGVLIKPPYIPIPKQIEFVKKAKYLSGFFGDVRPLDAMSITHLFDNIRNNATSKAVLIGFGQTAQLPAAVHYFIRGKELASKHIEQFSQLLNKDDLPAPPLLDHLVTDSTIPPFSDKIMMAHKMDMFSMRVRAYGNSLAASARHDVAALYARLMVEVGTYTEDGIKIMISQGWLEQLPQAVDREALALK